MLGHARRMPGPLRESRRRQLLTEQSVINAGVIVRCPPNAEQGHLGRIVTLVPLQAMFELAVVQSGQSAAD